MDALVTAAEAVLRRNVAPALRLSDLLRQVRAETGVATLGPGRLRTVLESYPDRFRVLDPWRGPWRFVRGEAPVHGAADAWVLVVGDPGDQGGAEPTGSRLERRLRASVWWLGLTLDAGSGHAVRRWHAMVVAEHGVRASMERKAA